MSWESVIYKCWAANILLSKVFLSNDVFVFSNKPKQMTCSSSSHQVIRLICFFFKHLWIENELTQMCTMRAKYHSYCATHYLISSCWAQMNTERTFPNAILPLSSLLSSQTLLGRCLVSMVTLKLVGGCVYVCVLVGARVGVPVPVYFVSALWACMCSLYLQVCVCGCTRACTCLPA